MTAINNMPNTSSAASSSPSSVSLSATAKRWVNRLAPGLGFSVRTRRRKRDFKNAHGGAEFRAKEALVSNYGKRILNGPFKDMQYGDNVSCSAYVAKLVGAYEEELHGVVEQIIARNYLKLIDVGSAEGYYAVGFAKRMPSTRVYAFDADPDAQRMCKALSRLNGVEDQVEIGGWCDHATLQRLAGSNAVVVCDCEGFELDLLDPVAAPVLRQTDMLIELHDLFRPGLTGQLLARFKDTHSVQLISTRGRDPEGYAVLSVVEPADRPWAVREGRHGEMQWAYLVANAAGSSKA